MKIAGPKIAGPKIGGMIGGVGPESTAIYYRQIVAGFRKAKGDGSYPSLLINSIDTTRMLTLIGADKLAEVADYLAEEVQRLTNAGATFGFISANAPHIVFNQVSQRSSIPLISIVESACLAARQAGFKRLGLIGARFTMQGKFYTEVFSREGITLIVPDEQEQNYIHEKYLGELVNGVVDPETRRQFTNIMRRLRENEQIEAVILGGTELSLMFQEESVAGIPLLDTTRIHVHEIVARLLA